MSLDIDLAKAVALPPEEAIRWFRAKGYAISWNWQETLQEANARAFTVAKMAELDLLKTVRQAVDQALAEGKTERWFVNTLTPVLQKAGWWGSFKTDRADGGTQTVRLGSPERLRLIYRQNLQSAYMAGRFQEQARLATARPYLQYVAVMDSRTRPSHAALNGKVYRFDDPIWQTHYPPNGWGCRCRVRQLSEFALKRRGLKVESSDGQLVTKNVYAGTDYETGAKTYVNVTGVKVGKDTFFTDPGFSYNPGGAAFAPDLDRYPTDIAKRYVEGVVTGPEFERWFSIWRRAVDQAAQASPTATPRAIGAALARDGRRGMEYPVAVLNAEDRAALGTASQEVRFSTGSLIEHLAAHPEVGLADYQRLQRMLDEGEIYQQADERIVLLAEQGKLYRASFKVDAERRRIYLLSLFATDKRYADRQVRKVMRRIR